MGGARIGGGDKPSIAPEKTLGRGPICSAAFSLRKPPRNSDSSSWCSHQTSPVAPAALRSRQISAASALSALDFPAASPRLPPCLRASASKSSAPLTRPSDRTRPPRCVAARSPLPPRSPLLTSPLLLRVFLRASAPPRQNHPLRSRAPLPRFPIPFHLDSARGMSSPETWLTQVLSITGKP